MVMPPKQPDMGLTHAQTPMHPHTLWLHKLRGKKWPSIWTSEPEPLLCAPCCGDVGSARRGSWWIHGGPWTTSLQVYRRTLQSRVPSAAHINCCADGKCGSSPWHHGEATAGQLGLTFVCLDACTLCHYSYTFCIPLYSLTSLHT